jgi:phage shock protein E
MYIGFLPVNGDLLMVQKFFRISILLISLFLSLSLWASDAIWIDVRSVDEYQAGHVTQAVNIPHTEIGMRIGEVTDDKDAEIYVYCRSGRRSGIARETLMSMGYNNVINLGGLDDAQEKALETP